MLCNKEIKFRALFDYARALGADYLATGHYCRIKQRDGQATLLRGIDALKDQSYFLHMISSDHFETGAFSARGDDQTASPRFGFESQFANG